MYCKYIHIVYIVLILVKLIFTYLYSLFAKINAVA